MKIKEAPSGETFINYDDFDYSTNGELVDINVNNIIFLYAILNNANPPDTSGWYTKDEVNALFLNYYTKEEIDDTFNTYYDKFQIDMMFLNYYDISQIDTLFTFYYTKIEIDDLFTDYYDIDAIDEQLDEIRDRISENTASINSINNVINANFETYGRYSITAGSLSDTDPELRFNINILIPLNSDYVSVETTPNKFKNLKKGKLTFNIIEDGIINDEIVDLTLTLRIYKNSAILDSESKIIEAGKTISINYAGTFETNENDEVYATLQVTNGEGTLTAINDVIINIDFNSSGVVNAVKSSTIINDQSTLPNNGINPKLNQIDTNTTNIVSNKNNTAINTSNINKLKNNNEIFLNPSNQLITDGEILTLTENYKNYSYLIMRVGFGINRVVPVLNTKYMNIGDTILIFGYQSYWLEIKINSNTEFEIISNASNIGIYKISGKEKL